jgi:hypothetical protein
VHCDAVGCVRVTWHQQKPSLLRRPPPPIHFPSLLYLTVGQFTEVVPSNVLFVAVGSAQLSSQWSYRLSITAEPINYYLWVNNWKVALAAPSDSAVVGFNVSWTPLQIRSKATGQTRPALGASYVPPCDRT